MVRVRIAPSPTGFLHIGTARTALFNYLFAKKEGGIFVLRVEDTDLKRSDPKYEKDIFDGLKWLGIDVDESPEKGGPYAPYRQSERIETYKKYIEKLLTEGKAGYCDAPAVQKGGFEVHWCKNHGGSNDAGRGIIRLKNPVSSFDNGGINKSITFNDLIRGKIQTLLDTLGDISIAKDVNTPLYNFAVVVDDEEMKISHIIRGEDHISNTPKQMLVIEALGFSQPQYAHLPLILGPDRSKLSKRHGATSVNEYREQGYLPEALFNFMALLGWSPGDDKEIFSKEELFRGFSLEKTQKSGAIFDIIKLDWMNGHYIRHKSVKELTELCLPYLPAKSNLTSEKLEKIIALEQPRLKKLSEIGERVDYFFRDPKYDKELLRWKKMVDEEIKSSLEFSEKIISGLKEDQIYREVVEKMFLDAIGEGDKGKILWPLRVALTGKKASPGPFEIMEILGKEEALNRIRTAKDISRGRTS